MELARSALFALGPALVWLWLWYRRDRWEPEPKRLVLLAFVLGAFMAAPAYWLEGALPLPPGPLFEFFVRVALVEEVCKLLPVLWFLLRVKEFDEPMDGILYAAAAALGFATVENALYGFQLGNGLVLPRAFTSALAHLGFSGLVGYHLGLARFRGRGRVWLVLRALLAVVVMHGFYDLLLARGATEAISRGAILLTVPLLLLMLWWAANCADRLSPFRDDSRPAR